MKQMMRERNQMKGEVEIKGMCEEVTSDRVHMETREWMKIIERMYN